MRRRPTFSLLARAFALMASLMLLSVLAWLVAYTHFQREPRAQQLAQWVATSVNTVRPALINAEAGKRLDLLSDLATAENIRIYPAEPGDPITPLPQNELLASLTAHVQQSLGPRTRFAAAVDGTPGFWVSFLIDEHDEYWMRLPMEHILPETRQTWLGWAALALAAALAAAWGLVAYLTRPLGRLAAAAQAVARGEAVAALDERGPPEIGAVAAAFNHMSQSLQAMESDRAISLAGVSHDLRTPLARLRLEIEMAGLDEATREAMAQEVDEMDGIIGQFIDYARGVNDEPWDEVDLSELIAAQVGAFARRGVDFEYSPGSLPSITAQPLAIKRALTNLIHNAVKYAGGEHPIGIEVRSVGDTVEIDILDRGPGIAPEQAHAVKRAFVRGEAARSNAGGAGLGLAIVERIARYHGGRLELLPREGGGLIARLALSRTQPTP